jgi:hypothetical protein
VRLFHLSLAALMASALLTGPAFAQPESRLDPQPPPPATAPPPVPIPPFTPPTGKAALIEAPLPDPPGKRSNPPLCRGWTYPTPMPMLVYPIELDHPIWVNGDGGVAHDMSGGMPATAVQYMVILRDGSAVLAREAPWIAGGTVRFPNPRGLLVSVRASEVDLAATAEANGVDWHAVPAPAAPAAATPPAAPPR